MCLILAGSWCMVYLDGGVHDLGLGSHEEAMSDNDIIVISCTQNDVIECMGWK